MKVLGFTACFIFTFISFAVAQRITTQGKEFYLSFYNHSTTPPSTTVYLSAKNSTIGQIINPATGYNQSFSVAAGSVTTVNVPLNDCYTYTYGFVAGKGLRIISADTISVYAVNYRPYSSDGTNVLQTGALGTDYIAACYKEFHLSDQIFPTHILIEATEDNTVIAVKPKTVTLSGQPAGVTFSITLNKCQTYLIGSNGDLSGSEIKVTNGCKPIAVFSGNPITNVPYNYAYADHLYEQLFPVVSWGSRFVTAPLRGRNTSRIRVYAAYDNTIVKVDNAVATLLSAGSFYEFESFNIPKYIETSRPAEVMLFGTGQQYDSNNGPLNNGDPTMITINPVEQNLKDGIFLSPAIGVITAHSLSIVCKTSDAPLTTFDGNAVAGFATVPGNNAYSFVSISILPGAHRIKNPGGLSAYVYGFGDTQGYGFNIGSFADRINSTFSVDGTATANNDTLNICKNRPVTFRALLSEPVSSLQWDFGDGSPLLSTGGNISQQIHSFTSGGLYIVKLRTIISSGNNCQQNDTIVHYTTVRIAPDLGPDKTVNICSSSVTDLTSLYTTAGLSVYWTENGNVVSNPSSVAHGNYRLVVSNGTCTDTAYVSVTGPVAVTPSVTISLLSGTLPACAASPLTFLATPANGGTAPSFEWMVNGASQAITGNIFTTAALSNNDIVTVKLTSSESCVTANNATSIPLIVTISPVPLPAVHISAPKTSVCGGESLTFTAAATNAGNPVYQWYRNGQPVGVNSFQYTGAGFNANETVQLKITGNLPCTVSASVFSNIITVLRSPDIGVSISGPAEIPYGSFGVLTAVISEPVSSYTWSPAASLDDPQSLRPVASPEVTTAYQLDVVSAAGCKGSATFEIKVVPFPAIPNSFTPNGDGIHDTWQIRYLNNYPKSRIRIFTRTGQSVFESIGYGKPWNGTYRGKELPFDTYFYIIELNGTKSSRSLTGFVTIIK